MSIQTKKLEGACCVRVVNGTPFLFMPDGTLIPGQLTFSVEQLFDVDEQGDLGPSKVTITLLANMIDSTQE